MRVERNEAVFVSTTLPRLRRVSFLDGRKRFWDRETVAPLSVKANPPPSRRPRYIFHVSFCGSTLLSTLLDSSGSVLVLKEPHALVDVADALNRHGDDRRFPIRGLLHFIEQSLLLPATGETVVLKPSNWANNLIPHLCEPLMEARAVFVTMPRFDFLKAVFRGGHDRMAYTARFAAHLASSAPHRALLEEAIAGSTDPLERVARIAGLAHRLQEQLFMDAASRNGWGADHWLSLDQIVAAPAEATLQAAAALDLEIDSTKLETGVTPSLMFHAKNPEQRFSSEDMAASSAKIEKHHGKTIRRAADWADTLVI